MRTVAPALCLLLLAACEQGEEAEPAPARDPASEQALADQILVDPDLAHQNEGNAALTVSSDHSLPRLVSTPEAIAAARAEAALLVGGSDKLISPPRARPLANDEQDAFPTPAQLAASLRGGEGCLSKLRYSSAWAARMPAALPVYPGGATLEAAGSDAAGCRLRAVTFVSPAAPADLLSFYTARARAAKFTVARARNESQDVLSGRKGEAEFRLALRRHGNGLIEATLATFGG